MKTKTKKLYTLTPEHEAQLKPWADKWIANAMSTKPMDDADREAMRTAINGMYAATKLDLPTNIVFAPGPISGAIAASISSGVWWLRENDFLGRRWSEAEIRAASQSIDLLHKRSYDTHETIRMLTKPGDVFKIRRQREYTPEGWRRVED